MSDVTDTGPNGSTATQSPPPPPPPAGIGTAAPPPPGPPDRGRGGRGRAGLGVALIVLGALFLVGRVFPQVSWASMWPLIIIAVGLISAFTPGPEGWSVRKLLDGLVTVAFGAVFLSITLGFVQWGVWVRIVSFWPVLVIALGFDVLSRALRAPWLRAVGPLLVIGTLAYAVITYPHVGQATAWLGGAAQGQPVDIMEPVSGATEGHLTLDGGVADIAVSAGGPDLISITGTSPWGTPRVTVERSGSIAAVNAKLGGDSADFQWPGATGARFDVKVSDQVLWDVRMNTGVASVNADLSGVKVRAFELRPGVADCQVRLGEVPEGIAQANAQVRSGVSSVTLRIPADAQGRVQIESDLSGANVRGGFEEAGRDVWETPGYREAKAAGNPVWLIIVRSDVGAITIDTY